MDLSKRLDELTQPQYSAVDALVDEIMLEHTPQTVQMSNMQAIETLLGWELNQEQCMALAIMLAVRKAEAIRKEGGELIV